MKKYPWFTILLLVVLLMSISGCLLSEAERRQSEAERRQSMEQSGTRIGSVELNEHQTFADLKKILGKTTKVGKDEYIINQVNAEFGDGLIQVSFVDSSFGNPKINEYDVPIRMKLNPPFKGSVCGVHLGDTLEKARTTVHSNYPNADDFQTSTEGIILDRNPNLRTKYQYRLWFVVRDNKIVELGIDNEAYLTI